MTKKTEDLKGRATKKIFRESLGTKCDIPSLSRATGIAEATLRRYKREPETIPLGRLSIIAQAMNCTPEDIGYVATGVMR